MQHFHGVVHVVHSTWSSMVMWHMHAPTFNKWQKEKNKNKKMTLHILTHDAMQGCGLTSLVVCINSKIHDDIRERSVITRSEIWTTNIRSLRFQDIRDWVTLWRLLLRRLGCNSISRVGNFTFARPHLSMVGLAPATPPSLPGWSPCSLPTLPDFEK